MRTHLARQNRGTDDGPFHGGLQPGIDATPSPRPACAVRHELHGGRQHDSRRARSAWWLAFGVFTASLVTACDPIVPIGSRICSKAPTDPATGDASAPIDFAWETGFEDGFCGYEKPQGFCFATGSGAYSLVTSPVHSGQRAAAFTVDSESDGGAQVRCVRQGVFPTSAYYGAWYYVPMLVTTSALWNLFHFQGITPGQTPNNLWDVSLSNASDGSLHLLLYNFSVPLHADAAIPIQKWFHIEVYFKRAKDKTGTLSFYQDGTLAGMFTDVVTDATDWGQWYVGNLTTGMDPPTSTVYVDDVTIRTEL